MTETTPPVGIGQLFNGERQYENFARLQLRNRVTRMPAAAQPYQFAEGPRIDLPESFQLNGAEASLAALLADTDTSALVVLKDGAVRFEQYWLTGSVCQYNSADTQALGMLVRGATGGSLTDYMRQKLYGPLGMESEGFWITDSQDVEMAFAGLLMTARDFGKLGELYRNGGVWEGRQLIP